MTTEAVIDVITSPPSASAGCIAGLNALDEGFVQDVSAVSPADDLPLAGNASTGCAAAAPAEVEPERLRQPKTIREFETSLREHFGFTARQAAHIAKSGFKATPAVEEPDDGTDIDSLRQALERRALALKGISK